MTGREKFKTYSRLIFFFSNILGFFGKKLNNKLLVFFRNLDGKSGLVIRYILAKNLFKEIGSNVSIYTNVFILNPEQISMGNNISIHPLCYIEGAGGIEIGDEVSIAHNSSLISTNHTWNDPSVPIKYNKENLKKIVIENDVWIGCGVRILAGVKIGSRSVIAAGAVVSKDFKGSSVIGGVPAKIIKGIH